MLLFLVDTRLNIKLQLILTNNLSEGRMNKVENIKFSKVDNAEQGSVATLQIIKEELENGRLHSIGLATGNTMVPVYEKWVNSDLDFSNVKTFNLDEYVGISAR